eukprot:2738886-Pyramimonas_sp.AAC.1
MMCLAASTAPRPSHRPLCGLGKRSGSAWPGRAGRRPPARWPRWAFQLEVGAATSPSQPARYRGCPSRWRRAA